MSIFDDNILEDPGEGPANIFAAEPIQAGGPTMSVKNSLRADQLVDVLLVTRDTEVKAQNPAPADGYILDYKPEPQVSGGLKGGK